MIRKIQIEGFKRFFDQSFALSALTILTGLNGTGKTSLIHALLLARAAWNGGGETIGLNGPFGLQLGEFGDVLNEKAVDQFKITILGEAEAVGEWIFQADDSALYAEVATAFAGSVFSDATSRSFQYLSADRLGPSIVQRSAALPPELLEVGHRGEYSAQVLDTLGNLTVHELRKGSKDEGIPLLLKPQCEQWLSRVTRPVQLDTDKLAGTGVVALKFRTESVWVRPPNMGYGLTYALPIVLAGLTAGAGGILIVENPEAHLHPAGQSEMGVFLSVMAASGTQVVVETHSDHVLNGIRRAIGENHTLKPSDAVVHFFETGEEPPKTMHFSETGGISAWPLGFFDQYQLDVAALSRVRRSR